MTTAAKKPSVAPTGGGKSSPVNGPLVLLAYEICHPRRAMVRAIPLGRPVVFTHFVADVLDATEDRKHIAFCQKKVFFDCGNYVVEVECFTDTFDKFSGFGRLRDQSWFVSSFLSEVMKPGIITSTTPKGRLGADRWRGKQPWRLTDNPSRWRNPETGSEYMIPAKSLFLPMNYKWRGHPGSVWSDVIAKHSEIANGWTDADLTEMRNLLTATPMILDGRLRLMPARSEHMKVEHTVATIRRWIANAEGHMQAGRIPLLKPSTLESLAERAEKHEIEKYGQPLNPAPKENPQRKLF